MEKIFVIFGEDQRKSLKKGKKNGYKKGLISSIISETNF